MTKAHEMYKIAVNAENFEIQCYEDLLKLIKITAESGQFSLEVYLPATKRRKYQRKLEQDGFCTRKVVGNPPMYIYWCSAFE